MSIVLGDCIEAMRELDASSVDAVVTDPPYGINFMGKAWDGSAIEEAARRDRESGQPLPPRLTGSLEASNRKLTARTASAFSNRAGEAGAYDFTLTGNRSFQAWCEQWGAEILRVLKPGGYALVFGGCRTHHRLTTALEEVGFEIRDEIAWMFGSGFPKSLDVSKAIDKRRDDEADVREVCRFLRASIDHSSLTVADLAADFGLHPRMAEHWAARDTDSQPTLPTLKQWDRLRELLAFGETMDAEVLRLNLRKGEPGEAWAGRPVTGEVDEWENRTNYALTSRDGLRRDQPTSVEGRRWQGWGTALKPAHEPIVVARKPLIGTVAANVLEHGTGAINVDGCRIEGPKGDGNWKGTNVGGESAFIARLDDGPRDAEHEGGRWPANVVLDEEAGAMLDEQSGELTSGANPTRRGTDRSRTAFGDFAGQDECSAPRGIDVGGASRFFYCAKTSRAERNAGLHSFPERVADPYGEHRGRRMEDKSRFDGEPPATGRNHHPTVKPIALMRWLVRLVTPPGGTVLDPFLGSGTTGIAAALEGFEFLGIEREPEYLAIAEARIDFWREHGEEALVYVAREAAREQTAVTGQLDLLESA